jgi:dCTP deaminase
VDAGFEGTITIGAFHGGGEPLRLEIGERVCQVCFEILDRPAGEDYSKRSGTWQGQRGIVLEPPGENDK